MQLVEMILREIFYLIGIKEGFFKSHFIIANTNLDLLRNLDFRESKL